MHLFRSFVDNFRYQHIEQLFRSLDLTSPPPDGPNLSGSQVDYDSPSTTSSYPNTPVENSPLGSRSADLRFSSACDFPSHATSAFQNTSTSLSNSLPSSKEIRGERTLNDNFLSSLQSDIIHGQAQSFSQTAFQSYPLFDSPNEAQSISQSPTSHVDLTHVSTSLDRSIGAAPNWSSMKMPRELAESFDQQYESDVMRALLDEKSQRTAFGGNFQSSQHNRQYLQPSANEVCCILRFVASSDSPLCFQPINFLSLLHPSSSPPYTLFVSRIVKSSDQQASIFLQQKLKVADDKERAKIIDAICTKGTEMMSHR